MGENTSLLEQERNWTCSELIQVAPGSLTAETGSLLCPCCMISGWGAPEPYLEDGFRCRRLWARSINNFCAEPHGELCAGLRYH